MFIEFIDDWGQNWCHKVVGHDLVILPRSAHPLVDMGGPTRLESAEEWANYIRRLRNAGRLPIANGYLVTDAPLPIDLHTNEGGEA